MRRNKIWMILAAACLAVTVTACGGQKESTTKAAGDQTAGEFTGLFEWLNAQIKE